LAGRGMVGLNALCWALLILGGALVGDGAPACGGGRPCVVGKGTSSYDNAEVYQTAVGCLRTAPVQFGSGFDGGSPPGMSLCELLASGECRLREGVQLTNSPAQQACCSQRVQDRAPSCVPASQRDIPQSVLNCVELKTEQTPGHVSGNLTLMVPFLSDLANNGNLEVCVVAYQTDAHGNATGPLSLPYCITFEAQRCSTCLQEGQSLVMLAKAFGTHWTQIYSANPAITSNPDALVVGQLVRLGLQYTLQEGDTLISIALKFGVSVNQLYVWNQHLAPLPDLGGPGDKAYLSRDLQVDTDLCVLPKTCLNSFGGRQPVYNLDEISTMHGGSWVDTPQVVPTETIDWEQVNA